MRNRDAGNTSFFSDKQSRDYLSLGFYYKMYIKGARTNIARCEMTAALPSPITCPRAHLSLNRVPFQLCHTFSHFPHRTKCPRSSCPIFGHPAKNIYFYFIRGSWWCRWRCVCVLLKSEWRRGRSATFLDWMLLRLSTLLIYIYIFIYIYFFIINLLSRLSGGAVLMIPERLIVLILLFPTESSYQILRGRSKFCIQIQQILPDAKLKSPPRKKKGQWVH